MARDVLTAKLDIIFKKFFSENKDMLKDFLSGVLEIPIESIDEIVIKNNELPPENFDGKLSRLDLSLSVDDKLINVEVQVNNDSTFRDRSMFYWSKLFTSELESGEDYSKLKPTITINIMNYIMFPERSDYHAEIVNVFRDTGDMFYDKFRIHFFELKKLGRRFNANDRRELWMQFINADSEEEFDMIAKTNDPVMKKAVRIIYDMSEDTRVRELARMREKAIRDDASMRAQERAAGLAAGLVKGREEGRAEERDLLIKKMKASGYSDDEINKLLSVKL